MQFVPLTIAPRSRVDWTKVTHIRLIRGRRPDTALAQKRWAVLAGLVDTTGLIKLQTALLKLEPVRKLATREIGIKADLRHWVNLREGASEPQDKGWLELGYLD